MWIWIKDTDFFLLICKFAILRFADWDTKDLQIWDQQINHYKFADLRFETGTPQKFAEF
jgi:hypothetical protein